MPPKKKSGNNLSAARAALALLRQHQQQAPPDPPASVSEEPKERRAPPAVASSPPATAIADSSASSALLENDELMDEPPGDALAITATLTTAPIAGPSVAPPLMDTAVWCRTDPAEVAAARAELQSGIFDLSLASKLAAPKLPKFPVMSGSDVGTEA